MPEWCKNKRSYSSNLLDFLHCVFENRAKHNPSDAIYVNIEKAFNKVPGKRLLCSL